MELRKRNNSDLRNKQEEILNDGIEKMMAGKPHYWKDLLIEFKETNKIESLKGDFSDLLYVLLKADDKVFPDPFNRLYAIFFVAQIKFILTGLYEQNPTIHSKP